MKDNKRNSHGMVSIGGRQVFYGWLIVGACLVIQWLASVLWMNSYGVYAIKLQHEFGWSMTVLAGAFAMIRLESGLLGPIQGWMADRYGPRFVMLLGIFLFSTGMVLFGFVDSLTGFFVSVALIAVGSSLGGWATISVAIVNWFDKHRSKAIALAQLGFPLGGLCVPLVTLGIDAFSWRTMAFVSAGILIAIAIPLAIAILPPPKRIGALGEKPLPGEDSNTSETTVLQDNSFTWRQAVATKSFWLISVGHAMSLLSVSAILMHLIPHLTNGLKLDLLTASIIFSWMTGMQLFGMLLGGFLGDYFNKRIVSMICMLGHCAGLLAIVHVEGQLGLILFVVIHGLCWGIRGPLMVSIRADYFGAASFGTIMGISSLIVMTGMTAGPLISGWLYDVYGNYDIAFTSMAIASGLGSLCFWFARPPEPQSQLSRPVT
ncbi:MAG: OFA family oxalate/formate antiporter-like MFS transporter [Planctomycetaceae bacterium]